jgi:hypothetical protein
MVIGLAGEKIDIIKYITTRKIFSMPLSPSRVIRALILSVKKNCPVIFPDYQLSCDWQGRTECPPGCQFRLEG